MSTYKKEILGLLELKALISGLSPAVNKQDWDELIEGAYAMKENNTKLKQAK